MSGQVTSRAFSHDPEPAPGLLQLFSTEPRVTILDWDGILDLGSSSCGDLDLDHGRLYGPNYFGPRGVAPWNNGNRDPSWGVAEIQKMSPPHREEWEGNSQMGGC